MTSTSIPFHAILRGTTNTSGYYEVTGIIPPFGMTTHCGVRIANFYIGSNSSPVQVDLAWGAPLQSWDSSVSGITDTILVSSATFQQSPECFRQIPTGPSTARVTVKYAADGSVVANAVCAVQLEIRPSA